MQRYQKFLKGLLAIDMIFVLAMAGIGYQIAHQEIMLEDVQVKRTSANINKGQVIPIGKTVGIYVNTKGILVIGTSEVVDLFGEKCEPAKNKLMPGDYITQLNGEPIRTKKQLIERITHCAGAPLVFSVRRNDKNTTVKVNPVETEDNIYKIGIWVRDDLQGLGTVTYVKGDEFGALGHSINDMDTGKLLEVSGGEIYSADIFGLEKGTAGSPGEIEGMIAYQTENIVGSIEDNQIYGIYGTVTDAFQENLDSCDSVEIANYHELKKGKAYIQSYVSGSRELYEIEITDLHQNENGDREMEIHVTDDKLISLTGGIIQGMSGSPVLQNGRIVGAVTHVFVDDPTRGYAIFIEEMLEDN